MKIKNKIINCFKAVKEAGNVADSPFTTFLSLDIRGNLLIDGKSKILQYNDSLIILQTKINNVNIYGEKLRITGFDNQSTIITGNILRIEFSEVNL